MNKLINNTNFHLIIRSLIFNNQELWKIEY